VRAPRERAAHALRSPLPAEVEKNMPPSWAAAAKEAAAAEKAAAAAAA